MRNWTFHRVVQPRFGLRESESLWNASNVAALLGRILFSLIFFVSAFWKITHFDSTVAFMQSRGIEQFTPFLLVSAIVLELFGATSLVLGWKTRWGTASLILFLIPTTLIFHTDFSHREQMWHFLKNLSLIGGLLFWWANGPGALSLEGRASKASTEPASSFSQPTTTSLAPARHPLELWDQLWRPWPSLFGTSPWPSLFSESERDLAQFASPIHTDVYEQDNQVVVELALPGLDPQQVDVQVEPTYVVVSGQVEERKGKFWNREIRYGSFSQTIHLPVEVEPSKAKAEYVRGLLRITIPKRSSQSRGGTIQVEVK